MEKRRNTTSYRISEENRTKLEALAWRMGFIWAGRGSVAKLLEAIADGRVKLERI